MSERTLLQRLQDANPYPHPEDLLEAQREQTQLLADIDERSRSMSVQQSPPRPETDQPRRWSRRNLVAGLAVAMTVLVVGFVVVAMVGDSDTAVTSSIPDVVQGDPLPLVDEWVDAMNRSDLGAALTVLSPETSCDLPNTAPETCEQHLGYLIAIGTHIERETCAESPPYRCSFSLTSQLHATLGYPDHSLPMRPEVGLDGNGLLVADFFGNIDTSTPYFPSESGDLWSFMRSDYPELNITLPWGPDPYDEVAGVAAMEAAREYNSPERVLQALQSTLEIYVASGVRQCISEAGSECAAFTDFLKGINAQLTWGCDPAMARDGVITCPVTVDSDIHRAIGSEPALGEITVTYRGGRAQVVEFALPFAAEAPTHDAFLAYAETVDGLFTGNGRPVWNAESAAPWIAAAQDFAAAGD